MKLIISFLAFVLLYSVSPAQNWSSPVNVSNRGINCMDPHMAVDHNGVIHAVWASTYPMPQYPRTLVLYAKSSDEGTTWSSPEILVDDTNSWIVETHIVCDKQNHLYVSYDSDAQSPSQMTVKLIIFDGTNWSIPFSVSENPGSSFNRIVIDHSDRLYCFWRGWNNNNIKVFYRFLENGIWSEMNVPFTNDSEYYYIFNIECDKNNNLHGVGYHNDDWIDVYYYHFNRDGNTWAPVEKIDNSTGLAWYGCDIAIDSNNMPHIVWGEFIPQTTSPNVDLTLFISQNETGWLPADTIEKNHTSYFNQLLINNGGMPMIVVLQDKNSQHSKLIQYINQNNLWNEVIIDTSSFEMFYPDFEIINQSNVGVLYFKGGVTETDTIRDIFFTKCNSFTGINSPDLELNEFSIVPNPFNKKTEIGYKLNRENVVTSSIVDLNGKIIIKFFDQLQLPGKYYFTWQGTDFNGKEVENGLYLVRLQVGKHLYISKMLKIDK